MNDFQVKSCSVMLEPLTPKPQTCLSGELHKAIEEKNLLTTRSKRKLLTDLKELEDQSIELDRSNRRAKAVDELLSSESSYQHQLEVIEVYFMKPIKERNILSVQDYEILFGSVNNILCLNKELLQKLKENIANIANVFIAFAPFLKVYSTYASYYKKSLNILLNAKTNNVAFFKFLELQESRPEVQQKLSALLIAPIQRIPRYRLLLRQILDNTAVADPSYLPLTESLTRIEETMEHINRLVGYQENNQRLIDLQYSLKNGFPSVIKADRKLIKEGSLKKISENSSRLRKKYFILMTDILMYCDIQKSNINSPNALKCKGILPLNKCEILERSNNNFKIHCKDTTLTVYHKDAIECKQWIKTIKEAISACQENKRSLRKDSSSRRPVSGKLVSEYQEPGVSPGIPRKKRHLDFDEKYRKCPPTTITKRKCIINTEHVDVSVPRIKMPDYINNRGQDSLYPLRTHLNNKIVTFADNSTSTKNASENIVHEPKPGPDVYVFGSNNQNRGFRFKFGSVFSGLTKSIKKLFGFGEN